jgi:hypothetical protein
MFPDKNVLKQGHDVAPLLFNSASEYNIRNAQTEQESWKLNCTHEFLVYADDVNITGRRTQTIEKRSQ